MKKLLQKLFRSSIDRASIKAYVDCEYRMLSKYEREKIVDEFMSRHA